MVLCSIFIWITNSIDHSGLGNYFVCKRFTVQTLLWSLEFVIQVNLGHGTTAVWNLARIWSISSYEIITKKIIGKYLKKSGRQLQVMKYETVASKFNFLGEKVFAHFHIFYHHQKYSKAIWTLVYQRSVYIEVRKKFKLFLNYDNWSQQSRNIHSKALKTLKLLLFLVHRQWIPPGLYPWTLPLNSQPSLLPNSFATRCHV